MSHSPVPVEVPPIIDLPAVTLTGGERPLHIGRLSCTGVPHPHSNLLINLLRLIRPAVHFTWQTIINRFPRDSRAPQHRYLFC